MTEDLTDMTSVACHKCGAKIFMPPPNLTLLSDALFALENIGVEPELCERIRAVLKAANPHTYVERGDTKLFDEMQF